MAKSNQPAKPTSFPDSPKHDDLRGYLLELYARVLGARIPTDQFVGGFLRRRPTLVGGAKGFLAATLYSLLRNRYKTLLLAAGAENAAQLPSPSHPESLLTAFSAPIEAALAMARWLQQDMGLERGAAMGAMEKALAAARSREPLPGEEPLSWEGPILDTVRGFSRRIANDPGLAKAPELLRAAMRTSAAPELLERWQARFGVAEGEALAQSFAGYAPLDLRLSLRRCPTDRALEVLAAAGVEAARAPYSPDGIRLLQKVALRRLEEFKEEWYEVQDEGSQLVSHAVAPQPGWKVLDACAGAGGKTLHLAELGGPECRIFAHDQEAARLEPLRKRHTLAGLENIRILEPGTAAEHGPYDAVLIDAPCLALGRLRRDPALAWRAPLGERLAEANALQRQCFQQYASMVKPGGVLVYAVCSIEPEETTGMVDALAEVAPELVPDSLPGPFANPELHGPVPSQATLLPSVQGTDGFFIARWRRS